MMRLEEAGLSLFHSRQAVIVSDLLTQQFDAAVLPGFYFLAHMLSELGLAF
jgi:hypothetical protein